jgi:cell division cycle protein 37
LLFRKAKELDALKKKLQETDPAVDSSVDLLKKTLTELEKERMEADKKWEEIQKQEKVFTVLEKKMSILKQFLFHSHQQNGTVLKCEIFGKFQLKPWNVDTISQDGFSRTKINKPKPRQTENLSEEEKEKRMKIFVKNNESDLKVTT